MRMPKRLCRWCSERLCRRCYERLVGRRSKEEHLYLVVDDWNSGYSIRRIDLPSGASDGGQRLPPALLRMVAERGAPEYFTAAFGAKIVMMLPGQSEIEVPLVDVDSLVVTPGPDKSCPCTPIYIPVGSDKLFVIDECSFDICCSRPEPDGMVRSSLAQGNWSWSELQMPPFESSEDVSSYAVDNQEQTIFVSTKGASDATFVFDIGESIWKHYGRWAMPFNGRGYYDRDLDGFVGISKDPDTLGYLYLCDMTKTDTARKKLRPYPDVKCSKVQVFNKNPAAERHLGATLMYRRHGKFCIVECVSIDDVKKADQELQDLIGAEASSSGSFHMYRVITFTVRYDKRADLRVKNYRTHCYEVPREATSEFINADPVAYWL